MVKKAMHTKKRECGYAIVATFPGALGLLRRGSDEDR